MAQLVSQNRLAANIAKQISPLDMVHFFTTEPGQLAIQNADRVHREWPFTIALDVSALGLSCPGESVVVQGIIDMIIPTRDGLVIVDFKTDKISESDIAERAARYTTQLALYAEAAAKILNTPVIDTCLYFLHSKTAHAVKTASLNLKTKSLSDIVI
jgi:ATP-dependent helicase/nuclease subunit A